jgi:hypothetical protein
MSLKISDIKVKEPEKKGKDDKILNDTEYKSTLFEVFSIVSKANYNWIKPYVQLDSNGEPNVFLGFLAEIYRIMNKNHFEEILKNKAFDTLDKTISRLEEKGGHPIDDKTAFAIVLLASGVPYEDVFKGMQAYELETAKPEDARYNVIDRAKKRVQRVKKLLIKMDCNIQPQNNKFKGLFDKVAQMPESEGKLKF